MDVSAALANVLDRCLGVRAGERVVLLTDTGSDRRVADLLRAGIQARSAVVSTLEMAPLDIPGAEVAPDVARTMAQSDAVIELTSIFIGSNEARRDANAVGVRYLAMPGITLDTLRTDGPLSSTSTNSGRPPNRSANSGRRRRSFDSPLRPAPISAAPYRDGLAVCSTESAGRLGPTWRLPTSRRAPLRWKAPPAASLSSMLICCSWGLVRSPTRWCSRSTRGASLAPRDPRAIASPTCSSAAGTS